MARRKIAFLPNQYYHVFNRGAHRLEIFRSAGDYRYLLGKIKQQALICDISVIAYFLMPNHFHFLLRQNGDVAISHFMQAFLKYNHSGTLFEGNFKAILVDNTDFLLHICRYIHRNPLQAGLVNHPSEWKFSNFLEWVGIRSGELVDKEFVSTNFGSPIEYQEFVLSDIPPEGIDKSLRHYLFV